MASPVNFPNNLPESRPSVSGNMQSHESDEGTLSNEMDRPERGTSIDEPQMNRNLEPYKILSREEDSRLEDDLALLQAERVVSRSRSRAMTDLRRSQSVHASRSRMEPVDQFDVNTNPVHERASAFRAVENPTGRLAKTLKRVHESSFLVRYFCYIVPVVCIFLIPILLGALVFKSASIAGVKLMWFFVWVEIVWLTLWAGRILAKSLPWPVGAFTGLFTNSSKKWRDMLKQLEIPATLFFWFLAILISFLPSMVHHHVNGSTAPSPWEVVVNKIIISLFVGVTINFIEKIIIQLIAISFHLRTYEDRIEINKFQIGSLTKLYQYSKEKINLEDSDFEEQTPNGPSSGARTPKAVLNEAQKKTRNVLGKVSDAAGKVAGDFTGKAVTKSTHPRQLVLYLLSSPMQSQILARRLYRTFVQEGAETITPEDLRHAFDNDDEAESSFAMFDKDLNGDISMSELEAVCVEIGRERKSITASLKDLDSVVAKLDGVLSFFTLVVTILVLLSLISTSAAGVLTSAGSAVLALSWLFSTTAQEFLASCIFVLVKHPYDVGDRVTIYGNTGSTLKGDDYMVKEISLLYTEFKKLEGHIVQAPNNYLNNLFILNMRRSGGLAEGIPLTVKYGTTIAMIDELRAKLLEFVKAEKREYQPNILTEIRDVVEAHSVNLNVVFFYKSSWQNELLRLQRRNKFICALMVSMQEIGFEGPRARLPGAKGDVPFYYASSGARQGSDGPFSPGDGSKAALESSGEVHPAGANNHPARHQSILRNPNKSRTRAESIAQLSRHVDFSLGLKDVSSADILDNLSDINQVRDVRMAQAARIREGRERLAEEDDAERRRESTDANRTAVEGAGSHSRLRRSTLGSLSLRRNDSQMSTRSTSTHRNRFFSRSRLRSSAVDEEEGFMAQEVHMAEIPEVPPTAFRGEPRVTAANSRPVQLQDIDAGPSLARHLPSERRPSNAAAQAAQRKPVPSATTDAPAPPYDFSLRNMSR